MVLLCYCIFYNFHGNKHETLLSQWHSVFHCVHSVFFSCMQRLAECSALLYILCNIGIHNSWKNLILLAKENASWFSCFYGLHTHSPLQFCLQMIPAEWSWRIWLTVVFNLMPRGTANISCLCFLMYISHSCFTYHSHFLLQNKIKNRRSKTCYCDCYFNFSITNCYKQK